MANTILHKRNLSTGNNPTTASLEPGELAINVADGKLFLRQSGSVANKIITVGESASFAATASYVNPLNQNVQLTGSLYLSTPGVASIYFTGSGIPGQLTWNDTDGTLELGLKGGVVKSELGQGLVTRVVNKTVPNVDLSGSNYQVVVVAGAQGQRLAVKLAQADIDANSAGTLGIIAEDIAKNQEGFIVTVGLIKNRNTTGALQGETWNDGDVLYLSPTTAGAITNVKPQAPQHTVIIGYVEYAHANNGKIYVKIDNGYELDELHNVRITTASLAAGQLLVRSGSNATGVWINTTQLTGSYGLTGSLSATSLTGSLFGTSSWASNAVTASFVQTAQTASYVLQAVSASYASTASYVLQSVSSSFATSASYAPDTTFPYTGSAIVSGSLRVTGSLSVLDDNGFNNINTAVRSLYGGTGTLSVDWTNLLLSNASGVTVVDWRNLRLIDTSTTRSIDWQNRTLLDTTQATVFNWSNGQALWSTRLSLDWRNRKLYDTSPILSADWAQRTLHDTSTTQSVDWNNRYLSDTSANTTIDWEGRRQYDTSTSSSINWGSRLLVDSTEITSVDWGSRSALDVNAVSSIDWNQRALYEENGGLSVDWNTRQLVDGLTNSVFAWDAGNNFYTTLAKFYHVQDIDNLDAFSQFSGTTFAGLTQNMSGEVIPAVGVIDAGVSMGNLVYLNSDGIWYKTDQTSVSSSYMLGVCVENASGKERVFLEGNIGFTTSSVADSPLVTGTNFYGVPIYISGSDGAMSTEKPTSGVVRIVGHAFYNSVTTPTNWLMKFRPSNDWYEI